MEDLNNTKLIKQIDQEDMLIHLLEMPNLCQQAWQTAMEFNLPRDYSDVNKIIISGMGASAIGGDLIRSMVASEAKLAIFVQRDYDLPSFVDTQTLVIASSYSGMTEEVLSSFEQALRKGAKKLVITTGGKLKNLAEKDGTPVFSFGYKAQPRAALPFSVFPIMAFLQKLGFISNKLPSVTETVQVLRELTRRIDQCAPLSRNLAKQLASKLHNHLTVIYSGGILAEVGRRWKTQLNENSKAWAFHEVFPELNHNAVAGYQFPAELTNRIAVVLLRSSSLPQQIKLRYDATCKLLDQSRIVCHIVDSEGISPLSQMMSLVLFGDYVSCYLAIMNKVDPTPVASIDHLKMQFSHS
ncbi:bifunctional phosphoglucose/phosphomannose isomerase [Chloroflexota bacterium]